MRYKLNNLTASRFFSWAPYLSLEDALKLDDVRAALRRGDLENAARLSRVYTLTPVAV